MNPVIRNATSVQLQKPKSKPMPATESEKNSACFDCNICLECASDPVVTLCGHLYCWPCLYKWFDSRRSLFAPDDLHRCPVCNTKVSEKVLVPLYGRGQVILQSEQRRTAIPSRPSAFEINGLAGLLSAQQQLALHDSYHNTHNLSASLFSRPGTAARSQHTTQISWQQTVLDWMRCLLAGFVIVAFMVIVISYCRLHNRVFTAIYFQLKPKAGDSTCQNQTLEIQKSSVKWWCAATLYSPLVAACATKFLNRNSASWFAIFLYVCGYLMTALLGADHSIFHIGTAIMGCGFGIFFPALV